MKPRKSLFIFLIALILLVPLMTSSSWAAPLPDTLNLSGSVTLTSESGQGILTYGGKKYEIDENSVLRTSGSMSISLKNSSEITVKQIQAGGYVKISGSNHGTLNVVNPDGNAITARQFYSTSNGTVNARGKAFGITVTDFIDVRKSNLNAYAESASYPSIGMYAQNRIYIENSQVYATGSEHGVYTQNGEIRLASAAVLNAEGGLYGASPATNMYVSKNSALTAYGSAYGLKANWNVITESGSSVYATSDNIGVQAGKYVYTTGAGSYLYAEGTNIGIQAGGDCGYSVKALCSSNITASATGAGSKGIVAQNGKVYVSSYSEVEASGGAVGIEASGNGCDAFYVDCASSVSGYAEGGSGITASNGRIFVSGLNTSIYASGTVHGISMEDDFRVQADCKGYIAGITTGLQKGYSAIRSPYNSLFSTGTGSTLHEVYKDAGVSFNKTPLVINTVYPAIGNNMSNLTNYSWSAPDNAILVQNGGLVANKDMTGFTVTATRTRNVSGEKVYVNSNGTHKIDIEGSSTITNGKYTVSYWDSDTSLQLPTPPVTKTAPIGTVINAADEAVTIDGYTFDAAATVPSITVKVNEAENELKIYYKRATAEYTVKYYKDSIAGEALGELTVPGNIGDTVAPDLTAFAPANYKTPGIIDPSSQMTITANSAANVVHVYYEPLESITYYIDYYYYDVDFDETLLWDSVEKQGYVGDVIELTLAERNLFKNELIGNFEDGVQVGGPATLTHDGQVIEVLYSPSDDIAPIRVEVYLQASRGSTTYELSTTYTRDDIYRVVGSIFYAETASYEVGVPSSQYVLTRAEPASIVVANSGNVMKLYFNIASA